MIQVWFGREKRVVELTYPDRPDRPLQYYREDDTLTIDAVPGLSIDLKDLFSIWPAIEKRSAVPPRARREKLFPGLAEGIAF